MGHLWDVVLCSLRGGERHGRHGHHDWLVGRVDGCRGSLRAGPYGGSVGGDGGPRRLHLSPLEKLEATRKTNSQHYIFFKKRKKRGKKHFHSDATEKLRCVQSLHCLVTFSGKDHVWRNGNRKDTESSIYPE